MITHTHMYTHTKLLEITNELCKVAGLKINTQIELNFYTLTANNPHRIKKAIPFRVASERIKYSKRSSSCAFLPSPLNCSQHLIFGL